MKLKALLAAVAVAGLAAAFGLTGAGLGDSGTTTAATTTSSEPGEHHCHGVEVAGTIASISATSLAVDVQRANREAASLVGRTATFAVGPLTHVHWEGVGTLTGPNQGDWVMVGAACQQSPSGGSTANGATAALVVARTPATASGHEPRPDGGHSTHR